MFSLNEEMNLGPNSNSPVLVESLQLPVVRLCIHHSWVATEVRFGLGV